MPIPKPTNSESESEFISRCMGDDAMVSEYPPAQRRAICQTSWDDKKVIEAAVRGD